MGVQVTTAPTKEPITLAEARHHLNLGHELDDPILAQYIGAAREAAESFTRRSFAQQTLTLTLDCFPEEIVLPRPPVQSVTSIKYIDTDGAEQTLATSVYQFDGSAEAMPRIREAYGQSWPNTRDQMAAVTIEYVAGYEKTPEAARQALLLMIGSFYEHREDQVIGSQAYLLPRNATWLLWPFRIGLV